jgi:hypothetical protein
LHAEPPLLLLLLDEVLELVLPLDVEPELVDELLLLDEELELELLDEELELLLEPPPP